METNYTPLKGSYYYYYNFLLILILRNFESRVARPVFAVGSKHVHYRSCMLNFYSLTSNMWSPPTS